MLLITGCLFLLLKNKDEKNTFKTAVYPQTVPYNTKAYLIEQ